MQRNVRGILFADYVRMMRGRKDIDWSMFVPREDLFYLRSKIEPEPSKPRYVLTERGSGYRFPQARG